MKSWTGLRGDWFKKISVPIFVISGYCALSGLSDLSVLVDRGSHIVTRIRVGALSSLYGGVSFIEPFLFFAAAYSVIRLRRLSIALLAACFASLLLRLVLSTAAWERYTVFTITDAQVPLTSVEVIFTFGIALIFLSYMIFLWRKRVLS